MEKHDEEEQKTQTTNEASEVKKRALGALLGACIGDAAGGVLEKLGRPPTSSEMAMSMVGGGGMRLASGQITDDGEMTISCARGLAKCDKDFDLEKIAEEYAQWVQSPPFDMGITIGASIGCVLKGEKNSAFKSHLQKVGYASAMKAAAKFDGGISKSNGSLMRCSPLAVYGHKLSDNELQYIASQDSSLSHPNRTIADAESAYVIALAHLIKTGDRKGAYCRAKEWVSANANDEVKQWLKNVEEEAPIPFHPNSGFAKIAFCNAFRHLLSDSDYVTALQVTLSGGGDTDTNGCIVGAMLGALGVDSLPQFMVSAVLNCDTSKGRPRPEFLHPNQLPELVDKLLSIAPASISLSQ